MPWWTFRLFIYLDYCKKCCSEHECPDTFLNQCFHLLCINTQKLIMSILKLLLKDIYK